MILIYAVTGSSTNLIAVAPFEQRDKVSKYLAQLNKEATEAGVQRRFMSDLSSVELWNFHEGFEKPDLGEIRKYG